MNYSIADFFNSFTVKFIPNQRKITVWELINHVIQVKIGFGNKIIMIACFIYQINHRFALSSKVST